MLQGYLPSIAGHLLAASVMNAPAGLLLAKMVHPETGEPATRNTLAIDVPRTEANVIEAAASGALTGMQLALNVAGMLIAFIALIAMLNFGVGWAGRLVGVEGLTIQAILGQVLRPLAWLMGVPWHDAGYVGSLIGVKTTLNEFVAYLQFASDIGRGVDIQARSATIASYALLGFANFSSIAIQIGGIGGLAPERRGEIARFGLRAMVAGNLAAFMSACWAGILL
jgi:CNT family concentrative nucleoside transporter